MTAPTRQEVLHGLIECAVSVRDARRQLDALGWDADAAVVMTGADAVAVLRVYLNGARTESELHAWADALESREDIDFEPVADEVLRECLFALANPEINGALTRERAWIF